MALPASLLYPAGCILGESPVWHAQRKSCFWVDIEGCSIYEWHWESNKLQQWQLTNRVSLIVVSKNNQLVLGMQGGVYRFNPDTGTVSLITDLDEPWLHQRCNDGACDSKGRLWIGTMQLDQQLGTGAVFCINENSIPQKKIVELAIPNGLAWSADNKKMYHTDSVTHEVWCYDYDEKTNAISFDKPIITVPEKLGLPDGIAMDAAGFLWVALWGGYGVGRWNVHTNKMVDFIALPVPQVTACAFVGNHLEQLLITTATEGMTDEALTAYPQSGHVFIAAPGVNGLPKFLCAF